MEEGFVYWAVLIMVMAAGNVRGRNISYDGRSLVIDGQRTILFSGSIHYPRSTPDMWPSLISKGKRGGLDVIETYVFWNIHEPQPGQYDFSGRKDLVRFIKEIHAQGLYACLRIGPFIESEWTYGGLPFWLREVPGIVFRSDNKPFKFYMRNFTTKVVRMMQSEGLYASQGGPIILSQIENEYQTIEKAFHDKGPAYVRWAAKMAVGLQTGVPWVMCKQNDAPDPMINTCNGRRCGETFVGPNSPNKPSLWTENWTTSYQAYGKNESIRSAEDIAFHVALFIARKNGSFINYYMYHGGTNFGRTASAFVPTSYYDQAPLDEYGLIRQPKWGHLRQLHGAIKQCEKTLLSGALINFPLGPDQEAYMFKRESKECSAFLVNYDGWHTRTVEFQNTSYDLPPKSISILPDCKTVSFNTAKVNAQFNTRSMVPVITFDSAKNWKEFKEAVPEFDESSFRSNMLLEQMNTTKDATDYLWCTIRFQHNSSDSQAVLSVNSLGHALHAFVNGRLAGSAHGNHKDPKFDLESNIYLNNGMNNISLLSIMIGLPDSGAFLEHRSAGLHRVKIQNTGESEDFTNHLWGYQVGLLGEMLQIYNSNGSNNVQWSRFKSSSKPLTWYRTIFDAPDGDDPLALNLGSMGKGEVWLNGQSIGRYWVSFRLPGGSPLQTWFHVPRFFLRPTHNLLVLFEEESGNPLDISMDTVSITKVCGRVSKSYPPPIFSLTGHNPSKKHKRNHGRRPKVHLRCPPTKEISSILFASYGNPSGDCESYALGSCNSSNSRATVDKACLGKRRCTIPQSSKLFGGDPCPGIDKILLIEAQCS